MRRSRILKVGLVLSVAAIAPLHPSWKAAEAEDDVTYDLADETSNAYPTEDTVPAPYKQFYEGFTVENLLNSSQVNL